MRVNKIFYYCDKCKREYNPEEISIVTDGVQYYELCKKCKYEFDNYLKKLNKLKKDIEELKKDCGFGKYIGDFNGINNIND